MLKSGDLRDVPRLGNAAGHRALIAGSTRLVFHLALDRFFASKVAADGLRFKTHVRNTLMGRLTSNVDRKDFVSYLLKAKESGRGQPYEIPELSAEARSLMVAGEYLRSAAHTDANAESGSDTTATQLAANFFYITQHANTWKRLNTEIRSKFSEVEDIRLGAALESCDYLKAVVEETLRINPSVPGYPPREVLPGGINIAGEYLPAGVEVGAKTTYALHHNPQYFEDSHEHRPERWLAAEAGEEKVQEQYKSFAPFSMGSRMCISRRLAYIELWITIATAVFEYDMRYISAGKETAHGPDVCEYKLEDAFVSKRDGPLVEIRRRQLVQ